MEYQGSITLTDLTDGINNAVVYLYMRQVGNTAPTSADNPTGTLTYHFNNGTVTEKTTGALNGWVSNLSNIASTDNPIYFITAIANSSSTTLEDDILPAEWSAPILLAKSGGNGQPGANGIDGFNQATIHLYQRAASTPAKPGNSLTYTFADGSITAAGGIDNNWQTSIPTASANGYPCYVISASAISRSATVSIETNNWTSPVKLAENGLNGAPGINTATVYLYQRAVEIPNPSKPAVSLKYTFANATLTEGSLGNWKQSISQLSGTNPIWAIAAVASSNSSYDYIDPSDWTAPVIMAENGETGAKGLNQATVFLYRRASGNPGKPANTTDYNFETGNFTLPSGWSSTIPSGSNPCWVTTGVAIGNTTYGILEWVTPTILVENGANGQSPTVTPIGNGVQITDPTSGNTYTVTNGSNGTTYFTHIRYSVSATPTQESDVSSLPNGKTYVGIQTTTNQNAPAWNDNNWHWTKFVGSDGAPAIQYYAYVKYAVDSNGTGMRDTPADGYDYVGTYTGEIENPVAGRYNWSKYKGDPGTPATQYYAFIRYSSNSSGTDMTPTPTINTQYVGTYAGTNSSPIASDYKWSKYVGTDGLSVSNLRELHYLKTLSGAAPSQITEQTASQIVATDTKNVWTSVIPTYGADDVYYICTETTLSNNSKVWSAPIQDKASTEANKNALNAQTIANATKQHFWDLTEQYINPSGVTYPAGTYITQIPIDDFKMTARSGNVLMQSGGIYFRDGLTTLSEFTPTALKFYKLDSTSPRIVAAQVDSSGLYVKEGGVVGGTNTAGNNGYIYLSTKNYGSDLSVAGTTKNNWRAVIGTNFGVDSEGNLYATSANLTGTITANNGTIGRFNITPSALYTGNSDSTTAGMGADAYAFWAGATNAANAKFKVSYDGALTASNADIKGHITATSGTIGNCEIVNGTLQITGYATTEEAIGNGGQRVYYRSTSNTPPYPNGAEYPNLTLGTLVTRTDTVYNTWTTTAPPLKQDGSNTKYPYLYTYVQSQTVAQEGTSVCNCTEVLLDESNTVIDGGSIITGSIAANKISVTDLSAIKADIGDITAGNITKGNNSINFDNSPATLEFKNASTWSSATQGIRFNSSGLAVKGAITATSLTLTGSVSGLDSDDISDLDDKLDEKADVNQLGTTQGKVIIDGSNILFKNSSTTLGKIDSNGMILYDGNGTTTNNQIAVFGKGLGEEEQELDIESEPTSGQSSTTKTWTVSIENLSSVTSLEVECAVVNDSSSETTDDYDNTIAANTITLNSNNTPYRINNTSPYQYIKFTTGTNQITITITTSSSSYLAYIYKAKLIYLSNRNIGATILGRYAKYSSNSYPLLVGNGISGTPSNALKLTSGGNMRIAGCLYVLDHSTPIGWNKTIKVSSSWKPSGNTDKFYYFNKRCRLQLTAGTYIATGTLYLNNGVSGVRYYMNFAYSTANNPGNVFNAWTSYSQRGYASRNSSGAVRLSVTQIINVPANAKRWITMGWEQIPTSGASVTTDSRMTIVRIR